IALEKLRLQKQYERDQVEAETPNQILKLQKHEEVLRKELETLPLEVQARELRARADVVAERIRQELRKEMLPLKQAPAIAQALAQMPQGMNVSIYGQEASPLASLAPLIDLVAKRVRESLGSAPPA